VKNHSPHQLRKRIHFGNGYRKTPPPIGRTIDEWGSGGSHAGIIGYEHADVLVKKSATTYSDIADTSI